VSAVIPGMMRVTDVREDLRTQAFPRLPPERLRIVGEIYDQLFDRDA